MHAFTLDKWYLDVTGENGKAFIGYAARLSWGAVSIRYSGYIVRDEAGIVYTDHNFRRANEPEVADCGNEIKWDNGNCSGHWIAAAEPIREELYSSANGTVSWNCFQPVSRAYVNPGVILPFSGKGYAEQIHIGVVPWKLPIEVLYWGRLHSESNYAVWIKWEGAAPLALLWVNGVRFDSFEISDRRIVYQHGEIKFINSVVLREGTLGENIFGSGSVLAKYFPAQALHTHECKLLSAAEINGETGTAIHERVHFK